MYRGHDDWQDMSDFVVHFTKPVPASSVPKPPAPANPGRLTIAEMYAEMRYREAQDETGYHPWMSILYERVLRAGSKPLGAARNAAAVADTQRVVCFSEIPLDMLDRLIKRRSLYGLGFRKDYVVGKGGAPLWYVDDESEQAAILREQIRERERAGVDPADPFWRLTPFFDHPGVYNGRPYRFEWEREWRVAGDMDFHEDDVAFLFLPEEDHDRARQFFADVEYEHSGPPYKCPYIDPCWQMDRIQASLREVPEFPTPSPGAVPWFVDPFEDFHDPLDPF